MFTSFYKAALFLAAIASLWIAPCVRAEGTGPFLLGGIQVHEPDANAWVETVRDIGMNTVEVTVYARQGRWDGADLTFDPQEPAVLREIRAAKAHGLHVALILRVAVDHAHDENRFVWHGMIQPLGAAARKEWFRRYTAFASHWATIAQREGIEVLGIGSELNALTATRPIGRWGDAKNYHAYVWYQKRTRRRVLGFADRIEREHLWVRGAANHETVREYLNDRLQRTRAWARRAYLRDERNRFERINERRRELQEHWIELIETVRGAYDGHLTYAANFDSYRNVGFWHRLDSIGINAYFSLRKRTSNPDPARQPARFEDAWRSILRDVRDFAEEQGLESLPVLFTELGYTFRRDSTVEPWAHDGFSVVGWGLRPRRLIVWREQPVDRSERVRALAALDRVRRREGFPLMGILYWKLSTVAEHDAIEPFVLHIGDDSDDPLQETLLGFLRAGGDPEPAAGAGRAERSDDSTGAEISETGESEGQVPGPSPRQQGHFRNGRNR